MEEKVIQHAAELEHLRQQLERLPHFHQCSLSSRERLKELRTSPVVVRLAVFQDYRKAGQSLFSESKFQEALDHYEEALSLFRWVEKVNSAAHKTIQLVLKGEELNSEVVHCLVVCYSNIAICNLKLEGWREAGSACDEVLKLDPENAKAKYRKAVALSSRPGSGLEEVRDAVKLLREAVQTDPSNTLIKAKLVELIDQLRKVESKSKEVCRNIFSQRTYEDVPQAFPEPVPRNRLREISEFIDRGEHTVRELEAEGKYSEAEKVKATISKIKQAKDDLAKQLEGLKMMKEAQGAALGDVLMATEVERLREERQPLLPQVPRVAGSKRWDWVYRPLLAFVSACTLVAYWLEKGSK